MPKHRRHPIDNQPINADWFYRVADGHCFFGYRATTLAEKIASGEIPAPISLSDTGRAKGWFGRVIIAWQAEREAKARAKAKVNAARVREIE
jgi:predicted DNA-binding transcriptional regulator AlpA